jgi:hypothetical protein
MVSTVKVAANRQGGEKSTQLPQHEVVKLIRKLRWIGDNDEAQRLEQAIGRVPGDIRRGVIDAVNTD